MSNRRILLLAGIVLIFSAGNAFAANSLDVNGDAALFGNFGLEVIMDGSTNQAYVEDLTPSAETVYRAEFASNQNAITMPDGNFHMVVMARGNGGVNMIRIAMKKIGSQWKIICRLKKDGAGTAFCGQFTMGDPNNTRIGFEWVTASGPGANDGEFRLLKNGSVRFERLTYDNDTLTISAIRIGVAKANVVAGNSGSFYLDDFSSFRTLAP